MPKTSQPAPKPPAKVTGIADALESLERRRRGANKKSAAKRGDLDLNTIR